MRTHHDPGESKAVAHVGNDRELRPFGARRWDYGQGGDYFRPINLNIGTRSIGLEAFAVVALVYPFLYAQGSGGDLEALAMATRCQISTVGKCGCGKSFRFHE